MIHGSAARSGTRVVAFLEAARQVRHDVGAKTSFSCTSVGPKSSQRELKTKRPTPLLPAAGGYSLCRGSAPTEIFQTQ